MIHRWIVKIPKNRRGVFENITEKETWDKTHDKRLVPVIYSFLLINIMPYAGPTLKTDITTEHRLEALRLRILDPASWNIAENYNGDWAFVDYACTPASCIHWCLSDPCACLGGVRTPCKLP